MPFRLNEFRAKIQFTTSARMPSDIYKACVATGTISNTVYIQHAVCAALSRDLGIPLEELLASLPENKTSATRLFDGTRKATVRIGPTNSVEEVQ